MSKETCFVHGRFRPAHSGIFTHCTCPKEETPMNVDRKYAPPSVSDGTVSTNLVKALRFLGDLYGPAGVANTAKELAMPDDIKENAVTLARQLVDTDGFIHQTDALQLARLVLEEVETPSDDIPNLEAADLARSHDEVDRWEIPELEGRETMCLSDRLIMARLFISFRKTTSIDK